MMCEFLYADGTGGKHVARGCVYQKPQFCKPSNNIKSCKTCEFDGCNDSTSLKSSGISIIITNVAVTCILYVLHQKV